MKIRPKNIPMFQGGGVPQWYLDRYGNRTALLGWDLNRGYNYSNKNLNINDHRNAGNLDIVYRKNMAYTGTPGAITSDILHFYNSNGKGMTAEQFVKYYNDNAAKIRSHWALDLTYNAKTAGEHNPLFRQMFNSRSDLSEEATSDYNIGYQNDLEDIEGSSTWLRRMDLYENEFDFNNPDTNRLHEITLSNGQKAVVYKKANGDIGLFNTTEGTSLVNGNGQINQNDPNKQTGIPEGHNEKYGFDWSKLKESASKVLGNPDLYASARLAGQLINNARIYDEALKGIRPDLKLTYYTHRQVVGDEATKQAYYRRAAEGETKAKRAITSDLDKQLAYLTEAKRIGDELRALGDIADNQEIRRTSDESNQHQWANTQRATEVANANIAAINQANALKLNLKALKHAANWASVDNFLQGIEYRKRQLLAELLALDDQIFALEQLLELLYDPRILASKLSLQSVLDKHTTKDAYGNKVIDYDNSEVLKAIREHKAVLYQVTIDTYKKKKDYYQNRNSLIFGKEGTKVKVTRKRKDDLLYKSAKDTVEHFRKMSKISSDALNRKKPKIEKLAPHPKGTRKYQLGGVAPFGVYKPVALGGETTTSTQASTSTDITSKAKNNDKETLDLIKTLFNKVADKGLPIDVSTIYSSMSNLMAKYKAFGEELDTGDIASMYLLSMQQLANISHSKEVYDKAKIYATQNDALNEFAVTSSGLYILRNKDGELIESDTLTKEGCAPITNLQLLYLREYSPQLVLLKGDFWIENVINNGIGVNKIGAQIKALAGSLGNSETKIEGVTKVESDKIKAGLQQLANAPAGYYKITETNKNSNLQILAALNYITNMLSPSLKAILEAHGGTKALIYNFLVSQTDVSLSIDIDPLTGKAAKDSNGTSKDGNVGDLTPSMAFYMGMGDRNTFVILDKTTDGIKINTNSMSLINAEGHNLGPSTLLGVKQSMFGSQLDVNSATMGDVKIAPAGLNEVLISDGMIHSTELPIDKQAASNGIIKPDFSFLKNIEKADLQLREMGIINRDNLSPELINTINKVYRDNNLPIVYNMDGSGKPILTNEYRRFAILNGYATEKAFEGDMTFNDGAVEVDDDKTFELFEGMMRSITKNEKYKLDRGFFGGTDLYKGTIYIPMVSSTISALGGTGYKGTAGEYMEIDRLLQQRDNALKVGYRNPIGNASIFK